MKLIYPVLFFVFISNCTRFILSPGINSDLSVRIHESKNPTDDSKYKLSVFKLSDQNLELALFDINNFSSLNPNFNKNLEEIYKDIKITNFAFIIEVFAENGLEDLNQINEIEIDNPDCKATKYIIYRYDYIKFVLVRGKRENIYPKFPEEKYQFEFQPKMANVEITELPRKRILIYFDQSCNPAHSRKINFKIKSQININYTIELSEAA
ncbi:hypothetical protein EHQ23_12230 [Leptospira bourretii]|uniref:Uncharacterized protein n=1 Tax=Leptospira bourretii TaxID=2484962 RepID=A0A4R9IQI2_9LEPT|nr:hypothetical protein [Leptospira bourretii]TGK85413.1 hypothetical protein EHQ23_12230 [Leptospira bourretii]TGK92783.1 hypothetical protein EHQ26_08165 [Leptospira bourretii]TGL17892.1 hypothetical protein EHQ47_19390 [Leptospira bourretii]